MQDLTIEVENAASGVRIFRLAGPLTLKTLFEFQDLARAESSSPMVVELSRVPYMDSAGLGAVLGLFASCHRTGRGFGVTGATERIKTLFNVAGVDGLIPTFGSAEIAERELAKAASA